MSKLFEIVLAVTGHSDGGTIKVLLPAQSINTFVVASQNSAKEQKQVAESGIKQPGN
jgi:hypothetical protein